MPANRRPARKPARRPVRPYEGISITPRGIRVYGGFRIGRYLRIGTGKRIVKF
jgi:hypothetical protein